VQKYARPNWKFFGHVNHYDLPRYINACDVAVQPSLQDGFGMVILQTLSCGVPVIASANTGGPDVIRDGENGFIVPARNAEIIADRIQLLHDDSRKLEMMKKAAAGIGSQDWSWSHYGNRYASFINSLLENSA
jgi:glycosyltransferase involved in cell wall biosynthesis